MIRFALRRLGLAALVALLVSAATFALIFVAGDPAVALAGQSGRGQDAEYLRTLYGLDRPWVVQYADWTWRALRGDFGRSLYFNLPVGAILWERVPVTLTLGCTALGFGLLLAVPLGIAAAMRPDSWIDRGALFLAVVGQAIPGFWLGLILIIVFGMRLGWVPISGTEEWRGYILPTVVLGYYVMPSLMRILRTGMIEVLGTDYIRAARAKGLLGPRVILVHALRNAALPLVSLAAVQFGVLLSGSIVIESVFALNGVGRLAWESILRSDLPVVQSIVLVFSLSYVLLTLAADLVNAWLDPRLARMSAATFRARIAGGSRQLSLVVGLGIVALLVAMALLAPLIAPHDPIEQNLARRLVPPSWMDGGSPANWLGTDHLGRDYLSRLIHGARVSLGVGFGVVLVAGTIGTVLGIVAGYFGGRVDLLISLLLTTRLAMPIVLVALAAVALVGSSLRTLTAVLALLLWDRFAVVVRATTQSLRNREFVTAARALGCSHARVIFGEMLPNLVNTLVVVATLEIAQAILLEAALSFLGLGVQAPTPSWGLMIAEGREHILFDPWLIAFPGALLFLLVLAINLLGDGLRDTLAPGQRL